MEKLKKSYGKTLIYDVSYRTVNFAKSFRIMFNKLDGFIRDYEGTSHWYYLALKNMMSFSIGLDIL